MTTNILCIHELSDSLNLFVYDSISFLKKLMEMLHELFERPSYMARESISHIIIDVVSVPLDCHEITFEIKKVMFVHTHVVALEGWGFCIMII